MTGTCGLRARRAAKLVAAALVLAWAAAGCARAAAPAGGSATACYQVAAGAIPRHVTLTSTPAACRGLSQVQVNVAVTRALRNAAAGVHGRVRQREVIARDGRYVAALIRAVPAPGPTTALASPSPPPGGPASARSTVPSRTALNFAALAAWLVTVGLGLTMMARWVTRARPRWRGAALNVTHLGLAVAGLLVWISYLATAVTGLAWAASGFLLAAASLGMALVFLAPATAAADRRRPVFVVAAHVAVAVLTILLATLAAIGAG